MTEERAEWRSVADAMGEKLAGRAIALGGERLAALAERPEALLAELTLYKFAAKMLGRRGAVLDIGCGDGLGTWILAKECGRAVGIDQDPQAVELAASSWRDENVSFEVGQSPHAGEWSAVVALHLTTPEPVAEVAASLDPAGVAVFAAAAEAMEPDALETAANACFAHVFRFSAHGELIHAGSAAGAGHTVVVSARPDAT
ncbi:MAG TPA: class I SAM-dependent methyltransferase [Thermoleophilaceae bacterium]